MRLLLLLSALLGVVITLDRRLELNASQPITVTLADGTIRELTAVEYKELVEKRANEQLKLQTETPWQRHGLEQLKTDDPQFALHIDLSRRAFDEIQRHGYAQGYTLAGFSEQETGPLTADYHVEFVLQAKKDVTTDGVIKTGTGTRKWTKEGHETPLSYEVQVLLDRKKRFSVVAAWELSEKEPRRGQRKTRVMRLSIQPTVALLEREAERARTRPAIVNWLLIGGLGLIAVGVLVMYTTRNPIPTPKRRRRSSDVWELVDETDNPIKMDKPDKKSD
ncbi:unnamed protein product [Peronospora destructor]|uniref:Uncharacterized protein n=1 Tax=Peronospora destructor TaxID=86335 RepID=A0AAV0V1Z7_9STRA|nr:unnamed protein product [Peronospora destructor]